MPMGKMTRVVVAQPRKKKVLSNKALTKQIRSLKGQEGSRVMLANHLYNADALAAGTPDINYFDDATLFNTSAPAIQHYYDAHVKLIATVGHATVRLLYGFDEDYDGDNLVAAEILDTTTDSASAYLSGDVVNFKESRNKNRNEQYRVVIVKDMIISLEQNVPKTFNIRLPLFNRKTPSASGENIAPFYPFMLALSDENASTISIGVEYYRTNLAN